MSKKNKKKKPGPNDVVKDLKQIKKVERKVDPSSPLNEFDKPPMPEQVVTPVRLFDWGKDTNAQKHANDGGISLLKVPANINMKGKKRNKPGLLVYAEDYDTIMIFKAWINADDRCLTGNTNSGVNRYRLLVGGKTAKKAQSYINQF